MINFLDPKLLEFARKNRGVFILIVLLAGNIYQYYERSQAMALSQAQTKELNQKIDEIQKNNLDYERERSEKLEFLLSNLAKTNGDDSKAR